MIDLVAVVCSQNRRASWRVVRWWLCLCAYMGLVFSLSACAYNPATGRHEFNLVSPEREREIGESLDRELMASVPEYGESPQLSQLVTEVGNSVGQVSERAGPWTIRILDEANLNAFAIPGGFIYITRGLLAYLNSQHQLAAVLAHEVAHVTARHGTQQLSRRAVASRGVGVVRIIDPNLRHVGGAAARSAGRSLLRHSRDHEHQADELGLRYTHLAGYRVSAMSEVLGMLAAHDRHTRKGPREPWLSTHPEPAARQQLVNARIARDYPKQPLVEPQDPMLPALGGLVYGPDPRDGFARGSTYHLPRLGAELDLPPNWQHSANRRGVLAAPTGEANALLAVLLTKLETASAGTQAFFDNTNFSRDATVVERFAGLRGEGTNFALGGREPIAGRVVFVEAPGGVWMLLGLADYAQWADRSIPLIASMRTFRPITDAAVRAIEPARLQIVDVRQAVRLDQLEGLGARAQEVALLNQLDPASTLEVGRRLKVPVWPGPQLTPGAVPELSETAATD